MFFVTSEQKPSCNYQRQNTSQTATKTCKKLDNIISKPSGNKKVICHKHYSNKSRICGNRFLMEPPVPSISEPRGQLSRADFKAVLKMLHLTISSKEKGASVAIKKPIASLISVHASFKYL